MTGRQQIALQMSLGRCNGGGDLGHAAADVKHDDDDDDDYWEEGSQFPDCQMVEVEGRNRPEGWRCRYLAWS